MVAGPSDGNLKPMGDENNAEATSVAREHRQNKHLEAAAHHLKAADLATRRGDKDAVGRHRLYYELHRRAVGLHKEHGVSPAIQAKLGAATINEQARGFTPHQADQWVI